MALVRMADCYQKMGDAKARGIYEQVVKDYADQKDAVALARARLGAETASPSGIVSRQVWKSPKIYSFGASISPDARYITFTDWETGDLAVHDLTTGADRRLTSKGPWTASSPFAEESAFAPDGKEVAYSWYDGTQRYELRTIAFGEANGAAPRILYRNEDIEYIAPFDWSPDGKWIAVNIERDDRTVQIGLVDAHTGALRVLKSGAWSGEGKLAFSPDSRFLAFDRPDEGGEQRDIFVLAVDGSQQIPVVVHPAMDTVVGWSANKLLFSSDRSGTTALWAVTMRDGKPQGAPELVKSDIGPVFPLGITRSGCLYYGVRDGGPDIYTASIDFVSAKLLSFPQPATTSFMGLNRQPDWSPDGKYLAYVTQSPGPVGRFRTLTIESVQAGMRRQLHPKLAYIQWPRWSPNGQEFVSFGVDLKGRPGVYRIDAQSGDTQLVVPFEKEGEPRIQQWAPDGKHIYYGRYSAPDDLTILERDLASGTDRQVCRKKGLSWQSVNLSPDGRHIAAITVDRAGKETVLWAIPVAGGEPRQVARLSGAGFTAWTPDGKSILVSQEKEIWVVSLSGGPVRKMDLGIVHMRGLRVQPGGDKVVFFKPAGSEEVWELEHFLPGRSN